MPDYGDLDRIVHFKQYIGTNSRSCSGSYQEEFFILISGVGDGSSMELGWMTGDGKRSGSVLIARMVDGADSMTS
jgi:hypothetical protein